MSAAAVAPEDPRPGPLTGVRVVELAGEWSPMAGKILADLGADVILVEPPGGHRTRQYEPHLEDRPGPDRSLWWWTYHTSKRAVELDLGRGDGLERLLRLLGGADVLVQSEVPGELEEAGLTWPAVSEVNPDLI